MKHTIRWRLAGLAALVLGLAAGAPGTGADDKKGTIIEIDGLKSSTPAAWVEEKPSNTFRLKQFKLPRVGEDKEDALMLVISLGGTGGSVEDNLKRWKSQFTPPAGKSADEAAKVETLKVSGVTATYLDIQGTYTAPPFEKMPPKKDYRMLAVFWDSKTGPYFFRVVGPARTVEHYKKGFEEWVKGFK
jgi:hypothetical protein